MKANPEDVNMSPVGFRLTRILTNYAQKLTLLQGQELMITTSDHWSQHWWPLMMFSTQVLGSSYRWVLAWGQGLLSMPFNSKWSWVFVSGNCCMTHATLVQSCRQNVPKVLQLGGHLSLSLYIPIHTHSPWCDPQSHGSGCLLVFLLLRNLSSWKSELKEHIKRHETDRTLLISFMLPHSFWMTEISYSMGTLSQP